jgi:hypothetical protein
MGTDRDEFVKRPCECGQGFYVVEAVSPDHPYSFRVKYEAKITCTTCAQKYRLEEIDGTISLVLLSELARLELLRARWREMVDEIEKDTASLSYYARVAEKLNELPSAVQAYEILQPLPGIYTLAAFRSKFKRHKCTADWVKKNVPYDKLTKVLSWAGITDPNLNAKIAEAETLFNQSNAKPQSTGAPLFKTKFLDGLSPGKEPDFGK